MSEMPIFRSHATIYSCLLHEAGEAKERAKREFDIDGIELIHVQRVFLDKVAGCFIGANKKWIQEATKWLEGQIDSILEK